VVWSVRQLTSKVSKSITDRKDTERLKKGNPTRRFSPPGPNLRHRDPRPRRPHVCDAATFCWGRRNPRVRVVLARVRRHGDGGFPHRPGSGHTRRDAALFPCRETHAHATGSTNGSRRRGDGSSWGDGDRIEPDAVFYRQQKRKTAPAAMVVTAMGQNGKRSGENLKELVSLARCRDAKSPRRLLEAIHEGEPRRREV